MAEKAGGKKRHKKAEEEMLPSRRESHPPEVKRQTPVAIKESGAVPAIKEESLPEKKNPHPPAIKKDGPIVEKPISKRSKRSPSR